MKAFSAGRPAQLEAVVARCVAIKARIVGEDERDQGARQLLNLGHTGAHAIELLSGMRISHGHAVAMGMALVARASLAAGWCAPDVPGRIEGGARAQRAAGRLPVWRGGAGPGRALGQEAARRRDYARDPERIGGCVLREAPVETLTSFFAGGLSGGGKEA